MTISVLIVDDHPLLREGIAAAISGQPDMNMAGEAGSGKGAIECFRRTIPEITLMDLRMPDMSGIEAIRAIRADFPQARIIVLTTYNQNAQAKAALQAGARAYLLKSVPRSELLQTIRRVHSGHRHVPAEIAVELAANVSGDALSPRELDVLHQIAEGLPNRAIGQAMTISEETVKSHVRNILSKLGVASRTHAVTAALKRGIIDS